MKKRVLSMLMSVVMLLSLLPVSALSVGEEERQETEQSVTLEEPADGIEAAPADDGTDGEDVRLLSDTVTVSGTVVFPHALSKNTLVNVSALIDDGQYVDTEVTMTAGTKEAPYAIQLPQGTVINWLCAEIIDYDGEGNLYSMTYLKPDGTCTPFFYEELYLRAEKDMALNLEFGSGVRIDVEAAMPAGMTSTSQTSFSLSYSGRNGSDEYVSAYYPTGIIDPGESTGSGFIVAPEGMEIEQLILSMCKPEDRPKDQRDLLGEVYYDAENKCSTPYRKEMELTVREGVGPFHMELLKGVCVSGTASLPEGVTYDDCVRGDLYFWSEEERISTWFEIEPGVTSANYSVCLPTDMTVQQVEVYLYDVPADAGLLERMYYNGQTWVSGYVGGLNLTPRTLDGLDVPLLAGRTITGTVSLPDGVACTEPLRYSIEATVTVNGERENYWMNGTLQPGETSASYAMTVPGNAEVLKKLRLMVDSDTAELLQNAYYDGQGGMSPMRKTLNLSLADGADMDLFFLPVGVRVSGTVSLPEGFVFSGTENIRVYVYAQYGDKNEEENIGVYVLLNPERRSAPYTIPLPGGGEYTLTAIRTGVYLDGSGDDVPGLLREHTYDLTELTGQSSPTLDRDWTLDLTLPTAASVSGTLSFARDAYAVGGLEAQISLTPTGGGTTVYTYVPIPDGGLAETYPWTVSVPEGEETYTLSVKLYSGEELVEDTNLLLYTDYYYGADGLTAQKSGAVPVKAGDSLDLTMPIPVMAPLALTFADNVVMNGSYELNFMVYDEAQGTYVLDQSVTIQNTFPVTFYIPVDKLSDDHKYSVLLYVEGEGETNLLENRQLYWTGSGFTTNRSDRAWLTAETLRNNLIVTLSGVETASLKLTFADDVIMDGSYELNFMVYDETQGRYVLDKYVTVEDTAPLTFSLPVDMLSDDHLYSVRLWVSSRSDDGWTNLREQSTLYWTGSGFSTSSDDQAQLTADALRSGLTVTASRERMLCGQVLLPDTYVNTGENSTFTIQFYQDTERADSVQAVMKPDGTFSVVVPVDEFDGEYHLQFEVLYTPGVAPVVIKTDANGQPFTVDLTGTEDITGVTFAAPAGRVISGQLVFPEDLSWQSGATIRWQIATADTDVVIGESALEDILGYGTGSASFETSGSGSISLPFTMTVSLEKKPFIMAVALESENTNVVSSMAYLVDENNSPTLDIESAKMFQSTDELEGISIPVPTGAHVPFTVYKPQSHTGSFSLNLHVEGENWQDSKYLDIGSNDSSGSLTWLLPRMGSFYVSYWAYETGYSGDVYVNPDGSLTDRKEDAQPWTAAELEEGVVIMAADKDAFGRRLSGTIHLPEGAVSPGASPVFDLWLEGTGWNDNFYEEITVGEDGTFSVPFPEGTYSGTYEAYIYPVSGCGSVVTERTYYTEAGAHGTINASDDGDITGLDFYPRSGKIVSGAMSLPDSFRWIDYKRSNVGVKLGWIDAEELRDDSQDVHMAERFEFVSVNRLLEEYSRTLPFSYTIGPEAQSFALVLRLYENETNVLAGYYYYGKDGILVTDPTEAAIFSAEDDLTHLTFTAPVGRLVEVTLHRPEDVSMDSVDVPLELLYESGELVKRYYLGLPYDEMTSPNTILIPRDGSFYVTYRTSSYSGEYYTDTEVYINRNGTQTNRRSEADLWDASELEERGLDFTLATKEVFARRITGTIIAEGEPFELLAQPGIFLRVDGPDGHQRIVDVTLNEDLTYFAEIPGDLGEGAWSVTAMRVSRGGSSLQIGDYECTPVRVDGTGDVTDVNFTIPSVATVRGTISLPEGLDIGNEKSGYQVHILDEGGSWYGDVPQSNIVMLTAENPSGEFLIPAGDPTNFRIGVHAGSGSHNWAVGPRVYWDDTLLDDKGYLTASGEAKRFENREALGELALTVPRTLLTYVAVQNDLNRYINGYVYLETLDGSKELDRSFGLSQGTENLVFENIHEELLGQRVLLSYRRGYSGQRIYVNPDGTQTTDRTRAKSFALDWENRFTITLAADTTAPTAVISGGSFTAVVNYETGFSAAQSTDNEGIQNYYWDFGDGEADSGRETTHTYTEAGTYQVTLTVEDYSGNENSQTVTITVVADDDPNVTIFTVRGTTDSAPVRGAELTVSGKGTAQTLYTNSDGQAVLCLPDGKYDVKASAKGFDPRSFSVKKTADNRAFTVYMNSDPLLDIQTEVHQMTLEEIEKAGIDTTDPANQHVYQCITVFEFGTLTYQYNANGDIVGTVDAPEGVQVLGKDVYLVTYSEVCWLKEMYDVALIVNNTSSVEYVEGIVASLSLPEGLSLAVMTEQQQSETEQIGTVAPGEQSIHHWYLAGDAEGEYYLGGTVSGARVGGGISEDIQYGFKTPDPIRVLAGSAMHLLIEGDRIARPGEDYHVRFTLTNVSDKPIYNVSLNVLGGKFFKDTLGKVLAYTPEQGLGGTFQSESGSLSVTELRPGEKISGLFTITFGEGIALEDTAYILRNFFSIPGSGSTTVIPTDIGYLHDWDFEHPTVTKEPTCTEEGTRVFHCKEEGCDETMTENIPALGHQFDTYVYNEDAVCGKDGTETAKCVRCDVTDTRVAEGTALSHDYKSVVTEPTCTERGYTTYTCTRCGHSYVSDYVDALGHDYKSVVTPPTCTEEGYTTYTCARCGDSYTADYVDALGHDYVGVTKAPTCTEKGYTTYTCTRCGDSYVGDYVDALGHDYKSVVTPPTCTEEGYTTYTCTRCDHSYVGDYVDALGHDYKSAVTPPTCTEEGYTTHTCTRCGESHVTDRTEALGHDYKSEVTPPTCTEQGYTTHTCTRCGDSYKTDYVEALGHDWSEYTIIKEPTLETEGEMVRTCRRCGAVDRKSMEKLQEQELWGPPTLLKYYGENFDAEDGSTKDIYVVFDNESEGGGAFTYTSSDENVLRVESSGPLNQCRIIIRNTGTATITATAAAVPNKYVETSVQTVITVQKAKTPLVLQPRETVITYGDPVPANPGYRVNGYLYEDKCTQLSGQSVYTVDYQRYGRAGVYELTLSGFTSRNYELEYRPSTLTVNKASNYTLAFDTNSLTWNLDNNTEVRAEARTSIPDSTAVVKVEYEVGGNWTETAPTDSGTYNVRAWLESSDNLVVREGEIITAELLVRRGSFVNVGDSNVYLDVDEKADGSVEVQISDEDARKVAESAANSDGDVTVDMTGNGVASGKDGLTLPQNLVRELNDSGDVNTFTVKSQDAEITMDSDVLQKVAETMAQQEGADTKMTLQISTVEDESGLTEEQKEILNYLGSNTVVLDLKLLVKSYDEEGHEVASESINRLGGAVQIRAAYSGQAAEGKKMVAFYINEIGETTYLRVKYENGFVCFATDHFSVYSVVEMNTSDILSASVATRQEGDTLHTALAVSSEHMTGAYAVLLSAYDVNGCQLATAMKRVTMTESTSVVSADFAACTGAVTVKAILLDGETFQPVADPIIGTV